MTPPRVMVGLAVAVVAAMHSPSEAVELYATTTTGELHISLAGGVDWEVAGTVPDSDIAAVLLLAGSDNRLLVTKSGRVLGSQSSWSSWEVLSQLPEGGLVDAMLQNGSDVVVVADRGQVWRSSDGGVTFADDPSIPGVSLVSVTSIDTGGLVAVSAIGEVYRQSEPGEVWSLAPGPPSSEIAAVAEADGRLVVASKGGDVWVQQDDDVWHLGGNAGQTPVSDLVVGADELFYLSTAEGEIAVSSDGSFWEWIGFVDQMTVTALGSDRDVSTVPEVPGADVGLVLSQVYPNPTTAEKTTFLSLSSPGLASINVSIVGADGRVVRDLGHFPVEPNRREVLELDTRAIAAGVYYVAVASRAKSFSRKLVVVGR